MTPPTNAVGSQYTASLLASLLNPGLVHAAGVCSPHESVCDIGEPLSAKLLQLLHNPGLVHAAGVCSPHESVCDIGEPLSAKLLQLLHNLAFVELHEFLLAPLLRAATGTPFSCADGHSCYCPHTTAVEKGLGWWETSTHGPCASTASLAPCPALEQQLMLFAAFLAGQGLHWPTLADNNELSGSSLESSHPGRSLFLGQDEALPCLQLLL